MPFTFRPNDRFAIVGKTGSGKSAMAMTLAGTFALALASTQEWEVWVLDTKNVAEDLVDWRKWGFRNIASPKDIDTSILTNAFYFIIESTDADGNQLTVVAQAQDIMAAAYRRGKVIVVADEYVSVVQSRQEPGAALKDIFQRGRGRKVGLIGLTQEPVYVPRQLVSQATHIFLFTLSYDRDIKWAREICRGYVPPSTQGDVHGFWYKWVDGPSNKWQYFSHQQAWYEQLKIALPKPVVLPQEALATTDVPW